MSFGNQGPRVCRKSGEAQNPRYLKSGVKFLSGFAGFKDTGAGSVQSKYVYLIINTQSHTAEQIKDLHRGDRKQKRTGYKTPKRSPQ